MLPFRKAKLVLGIPLVAVAFPRFDKFSVKYVELLGIIESYAVDSSLTTCLIIESDSLVAINSLSPHKEDLSQLRALFFLFP